MVLANARERAGLDLRTVEERTKIRLKYLQALEDEQWDQLPSNAYAKGFLRTYAQLLGLDAEALADEFRRQVEPGAPAGYPLTRQSRGPVGERAAEPTSRARLPVALALAAAVIAILVVIAIVAGGDGDGEDAGGGRNGGPGRGDGAGGHRASGDRAETVSLRLSVAEPVEVCLLGGGGGALIDGQVLAAGAEEAFERKAFELRFPKGFANDQFKLELGGEARALPGASGPAAYAITPPRRVDPLRAPGERCP